LRLEASGNNVQYCQKELIFLQPAIFQQQHSWKVQFGHDSEEELFLQSSGWQPQSAHLIPSIFIFTKYLDLIVNKVLSYMK
jgi:hypothetical protein